MSKKVNEERERQLYLQCCRAYEDIVNREAGHSTIWNDKGIERPMPSVFDDSYSVPAELLRKEVNAPASTSTGVLYSDFALNLLRMIHEGEQYDRSGLLSSSTDVSTTKQFEIYSEIYCLKNPSVSGVFKKQTTIMNSRLTWCTKEAFRRVVSDFEEKESESHSASKLPNFPGLYKAHRNTRFPELKSEIYLHPIKITVKAKNSDEATELASIALNSFLDCINTSQLINSLSASLTAEVSMGSKSAIVGTGVFLVRDSKSRNVDLLWTRGVRRELPKKFPDFTSNKSKIKFFRNLMRAFRDETSPAALRLRSAVSEFALAADTDNPNLRQLSFWRCLEIATGRSSGERKHQEIIKIFKNYYSNTEHWAQQGSLILEARNIYVHQGISAEGSKLNDFYLNWSQQYAEVALKVLVYLYNNRNIWATDNDIDDFFDHYAQTDRTLRLAGKLLYRRQSSVRKQ